MIKRTLAKVKNFHFLSLLALFLLAIVMRFYRLDEIPAEMWGDIVDNYKNIKFIFAGAWPFYFALGIGPLYLYLVAPFLKILGMSFFTMKIMSNVVGIGAIIFAYLYAKEVFGKRVALFTVFFFAVSKWALIFSRWSNANILVALFTGWIFYLLALYIKRQNLLSVIGLGIVTSLGMYIYPGYWLFPPFVGVIFLLAVVSRQKVMLKKIRDLIVFVGLFLIVMLPFFIKLVPQMGLNTGTSYIGSKLFIKDGQTNPELVSNLFANAKRSLLMFHVAGDTIFRTNVSGQKQIDTISGVLMIFGLLNLVFRRNLWQNLLLFVPFLAVQIPSIMVVNFPGEIPSATRTIGILPFLYALIALGADGVWAIFRGFRKVRFALMVLILAGVFVLNFYHYFTLYRLGLPDKNVPFAKTIAKHLVVQKNIDKVYMNFCCWGSSAQPEPNAVNFLMQEKYPFKEVSFVPETVDMLCQSSKKGEKNVLILSPADKQYEDALRSCVPNLKQEMLEASGLRIAKLLYIF